MRAAGYGSVRVDPGGGPMNFVVFDDQAHEVDVHLVDLSATRTSERGVGVYGPNGLEYEVGCLDGVGKIDGRQVACCTAESQIASHVGYELGETDLQDVKALRQRF